MLRIVRNRAVRLSLVLLTRVAAVCAVVIWQAPQTTSACNDQFPVWVVTGCGVACGCYSAAGYTCTPGKGCGYNCAASPCG